MKPNNKTQNDTNLDFDGMEKYAPQRSTKYQTNHYTGTMNEGKYINVGRGPTKGNQDYTTHEGKRPPIPNVPNTKIKDVDSIHYGAQERTPGGTRAWEPKGTQNYTGNSDKINMGRGPTKGNQE